MSRIIVNMQMLGFERLFDCAQHRQSWYYLFVHPDIGICTVSTYRSCIDTIALHVNYQPESEDKFSHEFPSGHWSHSTGTPSGYGYLIKEGCIHVDTHLIELIDDMKCHGRFVFPWVHNIFCIPMDLFSKEELQAYPYLKDASSHMNHFITHHLPEHRKNLFDFVDGERTRVQQDSLSTWNECIFKCLSQGAMDKKDKPFYTTCKHFITRPLPEAMTLVDDAFMHHTTGLGHNMCHFMAVLRDNEKKDFLWERFTALPRDTQGLLAAQQDLSCLTGLLLMARQSTYGYSSKTALLSHFTHCLGLPGAQDALVTPGYSLLDCLLENCLNHHRALEYLQGVDCSDLEIPQTFHVRQRWGDANITQTVHGTHIQPHVPGEVYAYVKTHQLHRKLAHQLKADDTSHINETNNTSHTRKSKI